MWWGREGCGAAAEERSEEQEVYPPSQKTTAVRPWVNAYDGPAVALAKVGASADSAEEMKDTTGVSPWRLHC